MSEKKDLYTKIFDKSIGFQEKISILHVLYNVDKIYVCSMIPRTSVYTLKTSLFVLRKFVYLTLFGCS